MKEAGGGKMFLAGERGYSETDWFRAYNTFNFGNYQQVHKEAFGPLYILNDDTLAGGRSSVQFAAEDTEIILIPLVGALEYTDSCSHACHIEAGQVFRHWLAKGTTFEIRNPYEADLINYLQLGIKQPVNGTKRQPWISSFDLAKHKNTLIPLTPIQQDVPGSGGTHCQLAISTFAGRAEAVYRLARPHHGLFVFVIAGAFEVQHRLLEARDGLSLWGVGEVEMEALSNDALILVLELPLPTF